MSPHEGQSSPPAHLPGRRPSVISGSRWAVPGVCVFLAVVTWLVFGQTIRHEFINFDDDLYVYQNPTVAGGLTATGMLRAFARSHAENWHPLTTLSHMLDCQWHGLDPGGHHLTSLLLHAATAMLLFLALRRMTSALWPSAFVAAVFAIHPLRVESVAWVAERKDVLSGLFFMLTLLAYGRYAEVRSPKPKAQSLKSQASLELSSLNSQPSAQLWYVLSVLLFACGLMSKPMLVTLPFVLLLLDFWPLRRVAPATPGWTKTAWRLIVEKLPFFLLSAAVCVVTVKVQSAVIHKAAEVALPLRLGNALVSSAAYLGQSFYPAKLAAYYPYPVNGLPLWQPALAGLLLVALSAGALLSWRRRPYFLVGWLWYLGMLVPVIGLIQVGQQARADRYTYLPQIGICLLLTWWAAELSLGWRWRRWVLGAGAAVTLAVLALDARVQTGYWQDSASLWTHTLACTTDNALAESNLGNFLFQHGQLDEAIVHCQRALQLLPDDPGANNCLGFALLQKGQTDEAIARFHIALKTRVDFVPARNNLGMALLQTGQVDEAILQFEQALATDPSVPDTHNNLGAALMQKGRVEEAVAHYEQALQLKPDYPGACNNLAWVLAASPKASIRNGLKAVALAQRADQLSGGGNMVILRTLAAAYAEAGRFPEAAETAGKALQLAAAQNNTAWIEALQSEIRLYQEGIPFRDSAQAP